MKKILFFILIVLSFWYPSKAYEFVDTFFTTNGTNHVLSVCLPENYNPANSYPLVVGLHYCNGTSEIYRQALAPMADSLEVIIICPSNGTSQFSDSQLDMITVAIDSAKSAYNINENEIFLTGMSCNGETTLRQGLKEFYPFKGIFPWVPWVTTSSPSVYDCTSDIPVVVAIGTSDQNYQTVLNIYDSLKAHDAEANLLIVQNIGHTLNFSGFANEMIRCMYYLNDTGAITISPVNDIEMFNNEQKEVEIEISHERGENIEIRTLSGNTSVMANPAYMHEDGTNIYKIQLQPKEAKSGRFMMVVEATADNGTSIEQVTFHVNVKNYVPSTVDTKGSQKTEIFPNPAHEYLNILSGDQKISVKISDLSGRLVFKKTNIIHTKSLDISGLNKGTYLVEICGVNNNVVKQLIIN